MQPSVFERLLVAYARYFPVRRGKMRVIDACWTGANGRRSTNRLATLKYGGLKMKCDVSEMLQRQFYFFGTYLMSEGLIDCWSNEARGARIVLDVGANAGIFSLAALAAEPATTVHAFEPTPEIAAGLRETATLNGLDRLYVHQAAVSSVSGHATLRRFRGEFGTNQGMNFITDGDSGGEIVATVCLDRFCVDQGIDRIDLLKLDIQGNEHQALAGAADLLSRGRIGMIFTELNWAADPETCPARASIRLLENADYVFSRPGRRLHWERAGDWMLTLSDIVARRRLAENLA